MKLKICAMLNAATMPHTELRSLLSETLDGQLAEISLTPSCPFCGITLILSAASLGVYAGTMLTEGCVLVPYWRSLMPSEFFPWYAKNGKRLHSFFGQVTMVAGLLSLASALLSISQQHPGRWFAVVASALMLAAVSTFYIYFGKANARFTAGSVPPDRLPVELERWATWHWWRTGLSFLALTAAMVALWHT